jgi:hypothetical protein
MTLKFTQNQISQSSDFPPGGIAIKPGDYRYESITPDSQTKVPRRQAMLAIWSRAAMCLAVTVAGALVYLALWLVIGRWAIPAVAGLLVLVALGVLVSREVPGNVIAVFAVVSVVGVFLGGARCAAGELSIPWQAWAALGLCWVVACLLWSVIKPLQFLDYRELAEVADPNGPTPPRLAVNRHTPYWPGMEEPSEDDVAQFTREEMEEALREALEKEPQKVVVEVVQPRDRGSGSIALANELDVTPTELQALAQGLLDGRPFSEGEWCDGDGALFKHDRFRRLQETVMDAGWAIWRNPEAHAQGIEFTRVGRAVLEHLSSNGNAPPPF